MHSAAPLRQEETRPAFVWILLHFTRSVFNLAELSQLVCLGYLCGSVELLWHSPPTATRFICTSTYHHGSQSKMKSKTEINHPEPS